MNKLTKISIAIATVIGLVGLSGCGGGGGSNTPAATPPPVVTLPPAPVEAKLSIANVTVIEGDSGATNAVFTVSLDKTSTNTITVDYATADATASADEDYTATSGTLTFNPNETTKTITVSINGDIEYADDDPTETFNVLLSNATVALNTSQAVGTITNDDMTRLQAKEQVEQLAKAKVTEYRSNLTVAGSCECSEFIEIDLDNDGDLDVLHIARGNDDHVNYVTALQESTIYRNNLGAGYAQEQSGLFVFGRDWEVRDFNNDGLDDVVLVDHGYDFAPFPGTQDSFIRQNSNGTLTDVTTNNMAVAQDFSHGSCTGDFDGNGFEDVFVAAGAEYKKLMNDGVSFTSEKPITNYEQLSWIYAGENGNNWPEIAPGLGLLGSGWCDTLDANNDGYVDILLGSGSGAGSTDLDGNDLAYKHIILFNDGLGNFTYDYNTSTIQSTPLERGGAVQLYTEDLNGDSCEDIVSLATNYTDDQHINIFHSDCNGSYTLANSFVYTTANGTFDRWHSNFEVIDLNDDGVNDMVFYAGNQKGVVIESNTNTNSFTNRALTTQDISKVSVAAYLKLMLT